MEKLDLHDNGAEPAPPKYVQLKDHLLGQLASGRLKPGDCLPSEMHLADRLHVARSTVRQAMEELKREGLIERVRGRGTFVAQNVRRRLHQALDLFALVVPETRGGYYPSLLHGFEAAGGEHRCQTIICNTDNDLAKQGDIVLQLLDKDIAGVALVPTTSPPTPAYQVRQLHKRGIPVVLLHRPVEGIRAPLLSLSFRRQGQLVGEAFVGCGHRRVAAFFTHWAPTSQNVMDGLREAVLAGGGDLSEEFCYVGTDTSSHIAAQEQPVREALERMCGRPDRPTAIFASFDTLAELIYVSLDRLGLDVPRDVSLIGFGGTWREGAIVRRLTSVVVDEAAIGRRAVELLRQMRVGDRPLEGDERIPIPLDLGSGQTLGPAPVSPLVSSSPPH